MAGALIATAVQCVLPDGMLGGTIFQGLLLKTAMSAGETAIVDAGFAKRYSRDHESEADQVGILLAARACYDPHDAQPLFFNLSKADGTQGQAAPTSSNPLVSMLNFSTHPEHYDREVAMSGQEAHAMRERERCKCSPVDMKRRKQVEKALKAQDKKLKRKASTASCSERHTHSH